MKPNQKTKIPDKHRTGLTLLELVAVVLLLGLVASVSAIGFGGSLMEAQRQQALETWLFYDQQCRTLADRSNQTVVLNYDAQQKTISRTVGKSKDSPDTLATGIELLEILNFDSASASNNTNRNQVQYFPNGQSETHLVRVTISKVWLVLGPSGQHSPVEDSDQLRRLFAHE